MCILKYVYIYNFLYIYVYRYIYMCIFVYIYIYICIYIFISVHINYICIYAHIYIHIHISIYIYIYIYEYYIWYIYIYIYLGGCNVFWLSPCVLLSSFTTVRKNAQCILFGVDVFFLHSALARFARDLWTLSTSTCVACDWKSKAIIIRTYTDHLTFGMSQVFVELLIPPVPAHVMGTTRISASWFGLHIG